MIHRAFAIFDNVAKAFLTPIFMRTPGQAVRAFSNALNSPEHEFAKHPEDYTLWQIGEYDDSTGIMKSDTHHTNLGNGLALKGLPNNPTALDTAGN